MERRSTRGQACELEKTTTVEQGQRAQESSGWAPWTWRSRREAHRVQRRNRESRCLVESCSRHTAGSTADDGRTSKTTELRSSETTRERDRPRLSGSGSNLFHWEAEELVPSRNDQRTGTVCDWRNSEKLQRLRNVVRSPRRRKTRSIPSRSCTASCSVTREAKDARRRHGIFNKKSKTRSRIRSHWEPEHIRFTTDQETY